MATVNEIYALLDQKAPFRTQLGFDNAGFLVGHGEQTVTNVLVALDITPEVIEEAIERGGQLIVAHHPVIWDKLGRVTDESVTGRKILTLIEHGIAAICAHTNLDAAQGGVNDALAQAVGLIDPVPLEVDGTDENGLPYGWGNSPAGRCPSKPLPSGPKTACGWVASGPWTPGCRCRRSPWAAEPAGPCWPRRGPWDAIRF